MPRRMEDLNIIVWNAQYVIKIINYKKKLKIIINRQQQVLCVCIYVCAHYDETEAQWRGVSLQHSITSLAYDFLSFGFLWDVFEVFNAKK